MKIDQNMNLQELAQRMGDCATEDEAELMRSFLLELPYEDTEHVPAREWSRMLACVVQHDPTA